MRNGGVAVSTKCNFADPREAELAEMGYQFINVGSDVTVLSEYYFRNLKALGKELSSRRLKNTSEVSEE